jgi:hypothetical protein
VQACSAPGFPLQFLENAGGVSAGFPEANPQSGFAANPLRITQRAQRVEFKSFAEQNYTQGAVQARSA